MKRRTIVKINNPLSTGTEYGNPSSCVGRITGKRSSLRSTLVTSQLPVEQWHNSIGDPTLADAILDRLVHNAYKINLKGESKPASRRAQEWQLYAVPGGSLHVKWVAEFSEIRSQSTNVVN